MGESEGQVGASGSASPKSKPVFFKRLPVLLLRSGVDSIDDLMADIAEQHEVAQEISDTISRPIGPGIDFDEVKRRVEAGPDPRNRWRSVLPRGLSPLV